MGRNEVLGIFATFFITSIVILTLGILLFVVTKQKLNMIKNGLCDEKIKEESIKSQKKCCKALCKANALFSIVFCTMFIGIFATSIYWNLSGNKYQMNGAVRAQVVVSNSMSEKHEKNTYLVENNLNEQFQIYDIIFTYELPKEEELKLYDIVVYEKEGKLIVHRIVHIEEPNEKHPEERLFFLRGDASPTSDKDGVTYSQMRGIYKGKNIPYVGIVIVFFQSTLGYVAFGILLIYSIVTPVIEKLINDESKKRLEYLEQQKE